MRIRFQPWVGGSYLGGGVLGQRVMVLGESHYASPADDRPSFTRDIVREYVYRRRDRFFTVVAKTVLPDNPTNWLSDKRPPGVLRLRSVL